MSKVISDILWIMGLAGLAWIIVCCVEDVVDTIKEIRKGGRF